MRKKKIQKVISLLSKIIPPELEQNLAPFFGVDLMYKYNFEKPEFNKLIDFFKVLYEEISNLDLTALEAKYKELKSIIIDKKYAELNRDNDDLDYEVIDNFHSMNMFGYLDNMISFFKTSSREANYKNDIFYGEFKTLFMITVVAGKLGKLAAPAV